MRSASGGGDFFLIPSMYSLPRVLVGGGGGGGGDGDADDGAGGAGSSAHGTATAKTQDNSVHANFYKTPNFLVLKHWV